MIPSGEYILGSTERIPTRDAIPRATNSTEGVGLDASMLTNVLDTEGIYVDTGSHISQKVNEHEFGENFIFHKLWILDIDLGAIVTTYNYEFTVWSTHRTPQSIIDNVITDASETYLLESLPQSFYATEERILHLHVEAEGPAAVDASYTFTTEDGEIDVVDVVGFRVSVMAWRPQIPVDETWEWMTNVMTSYNYTEQRVKLRDTPRQTSRYRILPNTKESSTALISTILGWIGNWWAVPTWTEQRLVSFLITAGDLSISVDTSLGDFHTGWRAIVWEGWNHYEVVNVSEVQSNQLLLSTEVLKSFTKAAIVAPVHLGMLASKVPNLARTCNRSVIDLSFQLIDTSVPAGYVPSTLYKTYEVLEDLNYTIGGISANQEITRPVTFLDNGQGLIEVQSRDVASLNDTLGKYLNSDQQIWDYKTWLASLGGRLKPFWIFSWTPDIIITLPFLASDIDLTIQDFRYNKYFADSARRVHLAFVNKSGGYLYREIVSSTEDTITLDSSLGFDGSMDDLTMICFLKLVRFNSDEVNFHWVDGTNVQISTPVVMVDE